MNKKLNPTQQRVKELLEEVKQLAKTPEFQENTDLTLHVVFTYTNPDPDIDTGLTIDGVISGNDIQLSSMMAFNMIDDPDYKKICLRAIELWCKRMNLNTINKNGTDD